LGKLSAALLGENLFDGSTYEAARDHMRLSGQLNAVRDVMRDRQWHTLSEIAMRVGGSVPGVSARIRDLRKPKFGGHHIDREYVSSGLWRYRWAR
jgi:hypothetical protein